ncbi:MAG: NAD-dependent epimerase/dehydratase family protein [Bdellovibrionota bacterium]
MAKYIITGGAGFVGKALGKALLSVGHKVVSVSRGLHPELNALGIETVACNLASDPEVLIRTFSGAEAVFHVASKVDMWGLAEDFYATNVIGTKNVIDACRKARVKKLIYTSTPSVVAHDADLNGVNEAYPYPKEYAAYYPETKAAAEKDVLSANGQDLYTIALRPHLIWGPEDTNLIPTVIERAEAGKLMIVGDGQNLVDICFITDCVKAHILAEQALENNPNARGNTYFISQGEPVKLWDWINEILIRSGHDPLTKQVSKRIAMFAAHIFEMISCLRPSFPEPRFTKFLVSEMSTNHYFDISAAKRDLGFEPEYSVAEAMDLTFGKVFKAREANL